MDSIVFFVVWFGFGLYVLNLVLGVVVQFRFVSTRRFRWVHHVLYGLVFAGTIAAELGLLRVGWRWWPLVLTFIALLVLPKFKGGSVWHVVLTMMGFFGYVLVFV